MTQFADLDPFAARRAKLQALRDAGIDPYPARLPEHQDIAVAREAGNNLGEELGPEVAVAGRIKALRGQGALFFVDVHDRTGKLQLLLKKDVLNEADFARIELLDLGDFIWASGQLFISRRGELTLEVHQWQIASKALHPLPDLWRGLQDAEARQRQRYAELIVSDVARDRFMKRSQLASALRRFMEAHDFVEVETAMLEHIPGGADAEPFVTHHNALDTDFFLRISLELQLKRMVVGGFERVYEIGKVFRNEGMSPQHLQEFTMFELYWAYADYTELMAYIQAMFQTVLQEVYGSLQIERGEHVLDFAGEWPRVSYVEIVKQYAGIDVLTATEAELIECIQKHGIQTGKGELEVLGRGRLIDLLYKKTTRPHLIQPQFLVDFPLEFSPLAKKKTDDPRLTERFVVLIDGAEVGNAFSELNDPIDQQARFEEQEALRLKGDAEAQRMDTDFVRALSYGMPPTAGFGVSIDRMMVIFSGVDSVRETVLFPTMRPEQPEKNE